MGLGATIGLKPPRGISRLTTAAIPAALAAPANPAGSSDYNSGSPINSVAFDAVATAEGYILLRSATETGAYIPVKSGVASPLTDNNVTASTTYWYKVVATNAAGEGARSTAVSVLTFGTPADLAGFHLWFEGNDGTVQSFRKTVAGNVVCANSDTCGRINNYNGTQIAAQATAGLRPTYNSTGVGAHGAIVGDSSQYLTLDTPLSLTGDFLIGLAFVPDVLNVFIGDDPSTGSVFSELRLNVGGNDWSLEDDAGNADDLTDAAFPGVGVNVAVIYRTGGNTYVKNNGVTVSVPSTTGTLTITTLLASFAFGAGGLQPTAAMAIAAGAGSAVGNDPANLYNYLKTRFGAAA